MVVRSFQRSDRCIRDFGYFFIFHFIEIAEAEYDPLFLRKSLYGFVELALKFVSVEVCVLVDFLFQNSGNRVE